MKTFVKKIKNKIMENDFVVSVDRFFIYGFLSS